MSSATRRARMSFAEIEKMASGLQKTRSWTTAADNSGHPLEGSLAFRDARSLLKGTNSSHSRSSSSIVAEEDIAMIGKKMIATNLSDISTPSDLKKKSSQDRIQMPPPRSSVMEASSVSLSKRERPQSNYELLKRDERSRERVKTSSGANAQFTPDLDDLLAVKVDEDLDEGSDEEEQTQGTFEGAEEEEEEEDEDEQEGDDDNARDSDNDAPTVVRRWTPEQDEALKRAVDEFGERHWKAIAARVPGRNHAQCLQRWRKVLKPGLVKGHWSFEEDSILERMVRRGCHSWGQVAASIPGRTAKQCRERWRNHLDPSINKGPFTPEEDAIIVEAQEKLGNRWSHIAQLLPGRTEDAVKMRWKSMNIKPAKKSKPGRPKLVPGLTSTSKNKGPPQPGQLGIPAVPANLPPELARLVQINNAKQAARLAALNIVPGPDNAGTFGDGASSASGAAHGHDNQGYIEPKEENPSPAIDTTPSSRAAAQSQQHYQAQQWFPATQMQQQGPTTTFWPQQLGLSSFEPFYQTQTAVPPIIDAPSLHQIYGTYAGFDPTLNQLNLSQTSNLFQHLQASDGSGLQPSPKLGLPVNIFSPIGFQSHAETDAMKMKAPARGTEAELDMFLEHVSREEVGVKGSDIEELVLGQSSQQQGVTPTRGDPSNRSYQFHLPL